MQRKRLQCSLIEAGMRTYRLPMVIIYRRIICITYHMDRMKEEAVCNSVSKEKTYETNEEAVSGIM